MEGKPVVAVGAGTVGTRRIKALEGFGALVTVIAPDVSREVETLQEEGRVTLLRREYREGDLKGAEIVIAATDDATLNSSIAEEGKSLGMLVSSASNKEECGFFFPAIVRSGDMVIGINGNGRDHRGVRKVRETIEKAVKDQEDR